MAKYSTFMSLLFDSVLFYEKEGRSSRADSYK